MTELDRSATAPGPSELNIVLVAHGEAESAGFFENLRVGLRTLAHSAEVMHLPAPLRWLIATVAALRKRWRAADGSLHNACSRAQRAALDEVLQSRVSRPVSVGLAFASCPPLVETIIAESMHSASRGAIYVSLSPSDSRLSCGLICHALQRHGQLGSQAQVVARLWDDPRFIALNAEHVRSACGPIGGCSPQKTALLLVLHGTLERDQGGQSVSFHNGATEKRQFAQALQSSLGGDAAAPWSRVMVAYLNHDVAGVWSQPTVAQALEALAQSGFERVVAFACDYVVESSELVGSLTQQLKSSAIPRTERLPCLNDQPAFIAYLAERLEQAITQPGVSWACDACPRRSQPTEIGTSGAKSKLS
ncbi:MAG: ferrochelatase [Wenzhouxiangella sp.]